MERGFKSRCEEISRRLRLELGLTPVAPMTVENLSSYLNVILWSVTDVGLSEEDLNQLVEVDKGSWSAITVSMFDREAVIFNPTHSNGRHSSNVMHELAHLVLGHDPSTMFFVGEGELALRGYNADIEREADWLAGTLLLPRDALVHIRKRRIPDEQACMIYKVSNQMLTYRLRMTGVNRQYGRRSLPRRARR